MKNNKVNVVENLKELYNHKELLKNLTFKELKLKYKNSTLGFFWSFFNPLLQLLIYTVVFSTILVSGRDDFVIFLLVPLLSWIFFSSTISMATGSISNNVGMIRKIYFPREIFPLSIILSNFINFMITFIVMLIFIVAAKYVTIHLIWLPVLFVLLLMFTMGLSLFLSAYNPKYRDIQHFIEVFLMAWMYLTPIIYDRADIMKGNPLFGKILLLNPMTLIVEQFRNVVYFRMEPDYAKLGVFTIISVVALYLGYYLFKRREMNFAEEI